MCFGRSQQDPSVTKPWKCSTGKLYPFFNEDALNWDYADDLDIASIELVYMLMIHDQ